MATAIENRLSGPGGLLSNLVAAEVKRQLANQLDQIMSITICSDVAMPVTLNCFRSATLASLTHRFSSKANLKDYDTDLFVFFHNDGHLNKEASLASLGLTHGTRIQMRTLLKLTFSVGDGGHPAINFVLFAPKTLSGFSNSASKKHSSIANRFASKANLDHENTEMFVFFHNAGHLDKSASLASLGLTHGTRIQMRTLLELSITVGDNPYPTFFFRPFRPQDSVAVLKRRIEETLHIPRQQQILCLLTGLHHRTRQELHDDEIPLSMFAHEGNCVAFGVFERESVESNPEPALESRVVPEETQRIPDGEMEIFIKTLMGKTITLHVDPDETIGTVKERIQAEEDIPVDQQRLVFAGRQLDQDDTLKDCLVHQWATIHLVLQLRGGMFHVTSGRTDLAVLLPPTPPQLAPLEGPPVQDVSTDALRSALALGNVDALYAAAEARIDEYIAECDDEEDKQHLRHHVENEIMWDVSKLIDEELDALDLGEPEGAGGAERGRKRKVIALDSEEDTSESGEEEEEGEHEDPEIPSKRRRVDKSEEPEQSVQK